MSEDCLFCKIVEKSDPATLLYEDEQCVAIQDIFPKAPVHFLVIPRQHFSGALEVDGAREQLVGHLVAVAARLARENGVAEKGFRLVFNTNAHAGQTVFHLHLHLLGGQALGGMA